MTPGKAVLFTVGVLAVLGAWALACFLVRRYLETADIFDTLTESEATQEHAHLTYPTSLSVVPAGFTCLRCLENPALPEKLWCAVCISILDSFPAEAIERGGLQ